MQDDEARDKWHATHSPFDDMPKYSPPNPHFTVTQEQLDFALGQVAYWKKKYEQARGALEAGEPPPDTINVAMGDLPMEYLLYQDQTGTWRFVDKPEYAQWDGHKRAILILESR